MGVSDDGMIEGVKRKNLSSSGKKGWWGWNERWQKVIGGVILMETARHISTGTKLIFY